MVKAFIAFHNNSNSGIQTRENAIQWATELLGQGKINKVYLAEVVEVVQRNVPPVTVSPFQHLSFRGFCPY